MQPNDPDNVRSHIYSTYDGNLGFKNLTQIYLST